MPAKSKTKKIHEVTKFLAIQITAMVSHAEPEILREAVRELAENDSLWELLPEIRKQVKGPRKVTVTEFRDIATSLGVPKSIVDLGQRRDDECE